MNTLSTNGSWGGHEAGTRRKENPRRPYAVGIHSEPATVVRGSSRRIMSMWFRPTDIRLIIVDASSLMATPRATTTKKGGPKRDH
jgi:hypothetical protein